MRVLLTVLLSVFTVDAQVGSPLNLPPCPDGPVFSVMPFEPADYLAFRPLGFVSVPIHLFPAKHSAFSMSLPGETAPVKPMRFPGDLWVTEIWSTRFPSGQSGYQIYYQPCAQMRGYFNHLLDIAAPLKEAFDAAAKQCVDFIDLTGTIVKCQARVLLKVQAGDAAGTSGDGSAGVDFSLADFRREPEGLIKLEHYPSDYPYYVSPVDYFTEDVKSEFAATLGSYDGQVPRVAEPRTGDYRPDVPGTAKGNWFFPGVYLRDVTDYSASIALVSDYVDPRQPVFSIGTSIRGLNMGTYSFSVGSDEVLVNRINVPFAQVASDGAVYCYERFINGRTIGGLPAGRVDGVILVAVPTDTTLVVEKQGTAGTSCESLRPWTFTSNATQFER